jgi:hypothetical protein
MLRKLTAGGPWAVSAAEDPNGVCILELKLESMLKDPVTADIARGFCAQFRQIVLEGPCVFTSHVFEYVDDQIFAFKRKRFRALGFEAGQQLVVCHIFELSGRKIPPDLIASARASHQRFLDHEQQMRRDLFRSTNWQDND